jgi:hypothetical protein
MIISKPKINKVFNYLIRCLKYFNLPNSSNVENISVDASSNLSSLTIFSLSYFSSDALVNFIVYEILSLQLSS